MRDVLDVFRLLISKDKSRTRVAVREFRQKINPPRRNNDIGDCDAAVAEWDADLAKLVAYRGQGTFPAQESLPEACCSIFPKQAMTFAQLKVDESFEPGCFREEMEKYIYRRIREATNHQGAVGKYIEGVPGIIGEHDSGKVQQRTRPTG